jgi:hypothetical protein
MVEQYLSGNLAGADLKRFQRRLQRDPRLRALLEEERTILRAIARDKAAIPILGTDFPARLQKAVEANPAPPPGQVNQTRNSSGGAKYSGLAILPLIRVTLTSLAVLFVLILLAYTFNLFDIRHLDSHVRPDSVALRANDATRSPVGSERIDSTATRGVANESRSYPNTTSIGSHRTGDSVATPSVRSDGAIKPRPTDVQRPDKSGLTDDERMRNSLDKEEQSADLPLVRRDSSVRMNVKLDKH